MRHPTKRKQLAKSGEVLGTKNGRNKSIEGHKKIRVEFTRQFVKKNDGECYKRDSLCVLITAVKAIF